MWGMIATWCMAFDGVEEASELLKNGGDAGDAIELAIKAVEDYPYFKSVGYGGLPNENMEVELDAAYMDGDTLEFGAVCAIKNFANPISIARSLSHLQANNILVAEGAAEYASKLGFEEKVMLTDRAIIHYKNRLKTMEQTSELSPYNGHDTVGMVCVDDKGKMVAGTSTSGLFMKKRGRVGDSPFIGSGLYVNSHFGGATATGLGEDILKGVISYEICRLLKEGDSVQEACEKATFNLEKELIAIKGKAGDISVVAMDFEGNWGAASTIENFSFVVATEKLGTKVFVTKRVAGKMNHEIASTEWINQYIQTRTAPLKEL